MSPHRTRGARYEVTGGNTLRGSVAVSGSKNAALAAMCAALLTADDVLLDNVPAISDVESLGQLLSSLGAAVEQTGVHSLRINAASVNRFEAPPSLVTENRASFQVMGPLLARFGFAASVPPGGDVIGQRPIDVHLSGFEAMGATVDRVEDLYEVRACEGRRLHGARVFMDYPTVSGTQNVLMAATLAEGTTTIVNAATEPEVQSLAQMLNKMGARVSGIGTQMLTVEGVESLGGTSHAVFPDRIEAGTYAIAAAITGGKVEVCDAPIEVMDAIFTKLEAAGAKIDVSTDSFQISAESGVNATSFQALPYPGLPTDLHAPMAALLTQARGVSIIHERVFDNRMLYVSELRKMGAEIVSTGTSAIVSGPTPLHGARVRALDVRAGAAVLLAALAAPGRTEIEEVYHLDRGYERLESKLRGLGADVTRVG